MICDICGHDRPDTKLYATEWDDVACCEECGGALKGAWDEMTPEQQAATLAEGQKRAGDGHG